MTETTVLLECPTQVVQEGNKTDIPKQIISTQDTSPSGKYGKLLDLNGNEFVVPDYTIKQIYDAIPAHCFERNVFKSLSYLIQDLSLISLTFYVFYTFVTPEHVESYPLRFALWSLYTFLQGLFGSGVWVLAHECGHQSFSTSKTFNDTLGLILHSALLVPYFSWKITHRNHHKGIGNMSTDTSFVPVTRLAYAQRFGKTVEEVIDLAEDTPIYSFFYLLFHQLLDWQIYMLIMIGVGEHWWEKQAKMNGEENPERHEDGTLVRKYGFWAGHYGPYSPLYRPHEAKYILLTDIALLVTCSGLYYLGSTFGWMNLLVWYGIPYLWVNHWLGMYLPFSLRLTKRPH
jgi:omega-6 fatty acid desaturase (delta-12 desaturase)